MSPEPDNLRSACPVSRTLINISGNDGEVQMRHSVAYYVGYYVGAPLCIGASWP
jgi:hypothetical protein